MPVKFKPVGIAHWRLDIPAIQGAGFYRKCSGLSMRVEHTKYHHGSDKGAPLAEWIPSGTVQVGHLTLERGVDVDKKLWDWHLKAVQGEPEPADGTLELLDHALKPVAKFSFKGAWPAAYKGPSYSAAAKGELAMESIEIAIDELTRIA
jgi:phage tail-like protein